MIVYGYLRRSGMTLTQVAKPKKMDALDLAKN